MEIELKTFGKIAEFIPDKKILVKDISDTDGLRIYLEEVFPKLRTMKYKLAVNRQILQSNAQLFPGAELAIMPPFSGG